MSGVLFVSTNSVDTAMAKKVESIVGKNISLLELHSTKYIASPNTFLNSLINAIHLTIFITFFYLASIFLITFKTNSKIKHEFVKKIKIYFQKFQGVMVFNHLIFPDWTLSIESHFADYGKPNLILIADDGILSNSAIIQSHLASCNIPIALIQTYSGVREEYENCFNTRKRKLLRLPLLPIYASINSLASESLSCIKRNILKNYTFPFYPWLRSSLLGFPTNDPYSGYLGYCSIYLMDHHEDLIECKEQVKFSSTESILIENPIVSLVKGYRNQFGDKNLLFLAPRINQKSENLKIELENLVLRLLNLSKANGYKFIIVEHPRGQGYFSKNTFSIVESFEKALIEFNVQLVLICNSSSYRIIEKFTIPIINYDLQNYRYQKTFGNRTSNFHYYLTDLNDLEDYMVSIKNIPINNIQNNLNTLCPTILEVLLNFNYV
jgi:hypothetical protein